jgi:hypothetical protein
VRLLRNTSPDPELLIVTIGYPIARWNVSCGVGIFKLAAEATLVNIIDPSKTWVLVSCIRSHELRFQDWGFVHRQSVAFCEWIMVKSSALRLARV